MDFLREAGVAQIVTRLVIGAFVVYAGSKLFRWLQTGISIRSEVQALSAKGVPTIRHSWILGHLPVFAQFRKEHPADVSIYEFPLWIVNNYERFFPGQKCAPPVFHMDTWPFSRPMIVVADPVVASSFTQVTNLPKADSVAQFFKPLTGGVDIVSTDGHQWKKWRSRLNPGFSVRNITALMPELVEEAMVFVDVLRNYTGAEGQWGPVFQFENPTTNLTLDIIVRATLDMRLNEQTRIGPSPLKVALLAQIKELGRDMNVARGLLRILLPRGETDIDKRNKVMRDFLVPAITDRVNSDKRDATKKTVVDMAIQQLEEEAASPTGTGKASIDSEFIDEIVANIKVFLFAGHDTTAATICWMFKLLRANPETLEKLRAEHDEVLSTDLTKAPELILGNPHLLYSLPYTLSVIKETLRLYPLAATIRRGNSDFFVSSAYLPVKLPTGKWDLWDGNVAVQCNPNYWQRSKEFLPERWLAAEGDPLYPPKDGLRAFELGPRTCIGQELAMTELRLVAVLVAREFDIEEAWSEWDRVKGSEGAPPTVNGERTYRIGDGTVHAKDGMPIHIKLRNA